MLFKNILFASSEFKKFILLGEVSNFLEKY